MILKPDALRTSSAVEQKAAERKKLVEQGTYKLPNPFYFVP